MSIEETALHDDVDYALWLQDEVEVSSGPTQDVLTNNVAATEHSMEDDDGWSSSSNEPRNCCQSLPGVSEQWHHILYTGHPVDRVKKTDTMNHFGLDAQQVDELMNERVVELASVNATPTSRVSCTSDSSELVFAETNQSWHDDLGLMQGMEPSGSVLLKHVGAHLNHMDWWNNTMVAYSIARNIPITRVEPNRDGSTNGSTCPDNLSSSNPASADWDMCSSYAHTLSVHSYSSRASTGARQGRRRQLRSNDGTAPLSFPGPLPGAPVTYYCTDPNCCKTFSINWKWRRHEAEVHFVPVFWVCNLKRLVNPITSRCIVCGSTTTCHHTNINCQKRPAHERTFSRKCGIKEHLTKRHNLTKQEARHYANDKMNHKNMDYQELFCFVCGEACHDWESRMRHIAEHFEEGVTKAQWEASRETYYAETA